MTVPAWTVIFVYEWAGLEPLPLPVMKGLVVRNFQWWLGQKMFDREGILTIGCDPNTSLYFTNVHLPAVKYHIPKGHRVLDTEVFDEAN